MRDHAWFRGSYRALSTAAIIANSLLPAFTSACVPLCSPDSYVHRLELDAAEENGQATNRPMKTSAGNFFEDFRVGQTIAHATPRTVTTGDVALYNGLFGARFAVQSSNVFASAIGYLRAPVDDLLVFHIVFGKTVPDISLNAVANL